MLLILWNRKWSAVILEQIFSNNLTSLIPWFLAQKKGSVANSALKYNIAIIIIIDPDQGVYPDELKAPWSRPRYKQKHTMPRK